MPIVRRLKEANNSNKCRITSIVSAAMLFVLLILVEFYVLLILVEFYEDEGTNRYIFLAANTTTKRTKRDNQNLTSSQSQSLPVSDTNAIVPANVSTPTSLAQSENTTIFDHPVGDSATNQFNATPSSSIENTISNASLLPVDYPELSSADLKIPANYKRHKFRVVHQEDDDHTTVTTTLNKNETTTSSTVTATMITSQVQRLPHQCSDDILHCEVVFDAECLHICEDAHFHRIESCLVPLYPLFQLAVKQATSPGARTTCLLHDGNGFMKTEMMDLLARTWESNATSSTTSSSLLKIVTYHSQRTKMTNSCWSSPKPGSNGGIPEKEPVCFNVRPNVDIFSSIDWCEGECRSTNSLTQSVLDIQSDLSRVWGTFTRPREDNKNATVILIDRPPSNRSDARAFTNPEALQQALQTKFSTVLVYNGSLPSFSSETAHMFGAASAIVHYHGAGIANSIFASPGTAVVELFTTKCPADAKNAILVSGRRVETRFGILRPFLRLFVGHPEDGRGDGCKYINKVNYTERDIAFIAETVEQAILNRTRDSETLTLSDSIIRAS